MTTWLTLRSAALRLLVVTGAWLVLAEGDLRSPILAGLFVVLATAASWWLVPPGTVRLSWRGLAAFVPFFLGASALGGIDVARRALDPRQTVRPEMVDHQLNLPPGPPRIFFAAVVSLLPGTLSAELRDDRLAVHVLDARMPVQRTLGRLETRVAALFGVESIARG
jgi:multicomponent Na+:H+ antiporter subunit E